VIVPCNNFRRTISWWHHSPFSWHHLVAYVGLELTHWVTTLIVPGVQMFRYSDFWVGQICSRPPDQPPFFPDRLRCRSKLEKRGGCPDTPLFCLVWKNVHLEQSETKKYHVEARGCRWIGYYSSRCTWRGLSPPVRRVKNSFPVQPRAFTYAVGIHTKC
jgi:hypothetical protein